MKLFAIGAFALASLVASSALAQTAQPQTGQAPSSPGPVIPGVCVYNHQRLLAQSTAGQALLAGMQRLQTEVQGELAPYSQAIQTEAQALQQGGASIPADQRQQRGEALQQRYQEAQQLAQTRENELRYTDLMERQAIAPAPDPILAAVYVERGCALLLARESTVLFSNPQMDITETVIQRLNTALPTVSFNRMPVPAQAPAQ
jgi:outer membrane protein